MSELTERNFRVTLPMTCITYDTCSTCLWSFGRRGRKRALRYPAGPKLTQAANPG